MKTRSLAPIDYGCSGETYARYRTGESLSQLYYPPTVLDYEATLRTADAIPLVGTSQWPMPSPSCYQTFDSTHRKRELYPNDCTNIKKTYISWYYTFGTDQVWNPSNGSRRAYAYAHYRQPHVTSWAQPNVDFKNFDACVSSNLRAEAYWTMRPKFEGEISMINALYELKDFKDIVELVNPSNLTRVFQDKTVTSFINGYKRQGVAGKSADTLASLHLFNAFAVQPLVADIAAAVAQAQSTVLEHQTAFGLIDENVRRFKRVLDPVQNLKSTVYSNHSIHLGSKSQTTFVANMSYKQSFRPLTARQAFVRYWGLNPLQIEAIWNGLPFSFLIDYFCSIGKSFHMMRRDPNIDIVTRAYTESLTSESRVGAFIGAGTLPTLGMLICNNKELTYIKPSDFTQTKVTQVTGYLSSHYQRFLTEPYKGPALPRIKIPSTQQGLNMLALLRVLL